MTTTTTPPAETVGQLAERLGKTTVTVWRWITFGMVVGTGRVKLAARKIGGQWSISREAWETFDRECNPDERRLPESPTAAGRRIAAGEREARELLGG